MSYERWQKKAPLRQGGLRESQGAERVFHHIGPSPIQDVTPNAVAIAERAATTTLMMVLHNIFLESSIMLFFLSVRR